MQHIQPLLLQSLVVLLLLLLLLAKEGEFLLHLHPCKHGLLFLLLLQFLDVLVSHAVQCYTRLLGFVQLLEDAFLVGWYVWETVWKIIMPSFLFDDHITLS